MSRPLVAVSSRPRRPGEVSSWPTAAAAVVQRLYLEGLWRAGADECVVAPRHVDVHWAHRFVRRVDGVVLVGGGDVDPAHYGEEAHPEVYGVEAESDALELALARAALALNKPLFAICRGMQILNVALGGTLDQHVTGRDGTIEHGDPRLGHAEHPVEIEPGSLLSKAVGGASTFERAWSFHHQVLGRVADGLIVTGRTADGLVEAVELSDSIAGSRGGSGAGSGATNPAWTLGIQWHPERLAGSDVQNQALFDDFVAACRGGR
jgi:putative glutamine amidotransferase